jgi:hypothetical protein
MKENIIESPEIESEDENIHGKLAHLNAVDLRPLSVASRYAYITLLHRSDELGRFMTHGGAEPSLPALSEKSACRAIKDLISAKLLRTWMYGASTCWELAGAYAYKPNLKKQLHERRRISKRKQEETDKRRQRRKDAKEGVPFAYEDDGTFSVESKVVELIRSERGNLLPTRPGVWFNSKVPPPKRKARNKMLIDQPDTTEGCILRMLPSFDPGEGLCALGVILRYYLLMESDDYGRVHLDVRKLYQQLGPKITKRVSKAQIQETLNKMERQCHLLVIKRSNSSFAFLRDSAQHLLERKRYDRSIPRLNSSRTFTHDSARYQAFFEACKKHAATRATVQVGQFSERGDLKAVSEYVELAARRFVGTHEKIMTEEPFCGLTPNQLFGRDADVIPQRLTCDHLFWYAAQNPIPVEWLEHHYLDYQEELDGNTGSESGDRTHKILTYLLKMTPAEFVEKAKEESSPPTIVP